MTVRKRSVASLADVRLVYLAKLGPRGWYIDHTRTVSNTCNCVPDALDPTCDVGDALFRLRSKELALGMKA